ncbi:MAG TPA: glucose 1-dehydrogenase [Candidatus Binataceae bacterium]|nr:glucose 1-dehydrogenase [Candidatus Binataceae bacterium]
MNLEGKAVLVTGGASGIGRATAAAFARNGAKVAIADIDGRGGEETLGMIQQARGDAFFAGCDVSSAADVKALIDRIVAKYGRLDCAANIAAIEGTPRRIDQVPDEEFDRVIQVNLRGVWLCMKYEVAQMLKQESGGAIVNLSSAAGLVGSVRSPAYGASKHGVIGLTKSVALQLAKESIRVNAVCPGGIITPMTERIAAAGGSTQDRLGAAHPIGRMGKPEEIAAAVLWLCSDQASYVTGFAAPVDGGLTAM